jgi:hypothetical protein
MAQLEEGCPQLTPALFLQTTEMIEEQPRAASNNCVRELQTTRMEPGCWFEWLPAVCADASVNQPGNTHLRRGVGCGKELAG